MSPVNRPKKGPKLLEPKRVGPWSGVRKSSDPFEESSDVLYDATNVYGVDTPNGSGWSQRPPFFVSLTGLGTPLDTPLATETPVTLSTESGIDIAGDGPSRSRIGQALHEHTRLDGTVDRLVFVSGRLYRWDGDLGYADLTPVSPVIDSAARIYCATFADRVIISDGVNRPWIFDPATLSATEIQYNAANDAWCAFGPPVVYGAKVFFILQSVAGVVSRTTITWSEENSPSTGYFQTNFDNTWTLSQTSSEPLTCLTATNVALFYFRARSIGAISGVVNSTFRTSSTLDSISNAIGTITPSSVVRTSEHIWFIDEIGRPHRFRIGSQQIEELWLQMRDEVSSSLTQVGSAAELVSICTACYQPDTRHVLFALYRQASLGLTAPSVFYAFRADSGAYHGVWNLTVTAPLIDVVAPMRDSEGRYSIAFLGQVFANDDTSRGSLIRQRMSYEPSAASGITWTDDSTAGGGTVAPVVSSVVTGQVGGGEADSERIFDKVSARLLPPIGADALRTFTLQTTTPRAGTSAAVSAVAPATVNAGDDGHVTFGLYQRGRWARFALSTAANTSTQPVVFDSMTITAILDAADPETP